MERVNDLTIERIVDGRRTLHDSAGAPLPGVGFLAKALAEDLRDARQTIERLTRAAEAAAEASYAMGLLKRSWEAA